MQEDYPFDWLTYWLRKFLLDHSTAPKATY
jgi:hypothetical protein